MAIVKIKKMIEDLENNTSQVLNSVTKVATTAGYAGTSYVASYSSYADTANYATTASVGTSGSQL